MKFQVVILSFFILVSVSPLAKAEDHGAGGGDGRFSAPQQSANSSARLFELMSACLAGRPFPASVSRTAIPPQVTQPVQQPVTIDNGGGAAPNLSGSGSAVASTGTPVSDPASTQAQTTAQQSSGGGDLSAGLAVFNAKCTGCHHTGRTASDMVGATAQEAARRVSLGLGDQGHMPMGADLDPADKANLIAWLNDQSKR